MLPTQSEAERQARRRAKFSDAARTAILGDVLADRGLLSRAGSATAALDALRTDAGARARLLDEVRALHSQDPTAELVGHGLRKLREVLVSVRASAGDARARELAQETFELSVQYYVDTENWPYAASCLEYLAGAAAGDRAAQHVSCLALYRALMDRDPAAALDLIRAHCAARPHLFAACIDAIALSGQPVLWYAAAARLPAPVRAFVLRLPAAQRLQEDALLVLGRAYNQLPLEFVERACFCELGCRLQEELARRWAIATGPAGQKTVYFKRRRELGADRAQGGPPERASLPGSAGAVSGPRRGS
ncbi:AFR487Cp [Eremothecium gossypii ATCC 10895]|uniref:AFR487Cp n=1 Tax=Eremothecium gossypii (strain ATCC 10895 / CBS 109.51 / FGSC 9923 / NRRL Y-1056) TaxID=284811 RepID=Q752T6_EREGS|nr:AFR487Cp [Eremothecium gossypii ATCC 10895]AAS53858.2 AFR487Cp [Eremothecium gossypii ATCC 10895]AEY98171.1 FAFR487Cp [Eremothecium gossypii FDAG1]